MVHEKFLLNDLEGGDFRMVYIAELLANASCLPPVFISRDSPFDQVKDITSFFKSKRIEFLLVDMSLEQLAEQLCSTYVFDAAFLSTWFWRFPTPSIAELVFNMPKNISTCLGKMVVVSDDVHWLRTVQGIAASVLVDALHAGRRLLRDMGFISHRTNEVYVYEKADAIVTISDWDAMLIKSMISSEENKYCTVPYAVQSLDTSAKQQDIIGGTLCYFGSGHIFNVVAIEWFNAEVWPLLAHSGMSLMLIGTRWDEDTCKRNGTVCDSGFPIQDCWVSIAPVQVAFSGFHTKIALALSHGIPVVATLQGAAGYESTSQLSGIAVANSATEFADILKSYLEPDVFADAVQRSLAVSAVPTGMPACMQKIAEATFP